jgi:hypothetical protein
MRRWLISIVIFLSAGALINIAVAWACVLCIDPLDPWGMFPVVGEVVVPGRVNSVDKYEQTGVVAIQIRATRDPRIGSAISGERSHARGPIRNRGALDRLMPSWSNIDPRSPESGTIDLGKTQDLFVERRIVGAGLPFRSLWAEPRGVILNNRIWHQIDSVGGYIETSLTSWEGFHRVLPLRPIWPGFTFNTIFYAAVLWLVILGPFVLRRFLRVKRDLCPWCAYPVGESAACTECGRPLPGRAVA